MPLINAAILEAPKRSANPKIGAPHAPLVIGRRSWSPPTPARAALAANSRTLPWHLLFRSAAILGKDQDL